jgi:hypothetical protein
MTWAKFQRLWLELLGDVAADEVVQVWEEVQEFGAYAQLRHFAPCITTCTNSFSNLSVVRHMSQPVLTRQLASQLSTRISSWDGPKR